jgi:hypothetical protein
VAGEPISSADFACPAVPDSVLPHCGDDELRALLTKAEAEVTANPLPFDRMMARLRDKLL